MTFEFIQSPLGADPIIVEGYLAATPKAVFRAWTNPEMVMKWFGPRPYSLISAKIDLRVGGVWRFVMRDDELETMGFEGEYLVVEPSCSLVMSWSKFIKVPTESYETPLVSQVDITLTAKGAGTDVRIAHSALQDRGTRIGFTDGWEHGMRNLRDAVERPVSS